MNYENWSFTPSYVKLTMRSSKKISIDSDIYSDDLQRFNNYYTNCWRKIFQIYTGDDEVKTLTIAMEFAEAVLIVCSFVILSNPRKNTNGNIPARIQWIMTNSDDENIGDKREMRHG